MKSFKTKDINLDVTDNPKISMSIFKDLQNSSQEIQEKLSILSAWCNQEKVIRYFVLY